MSSRPASASVCAATVYVYDRRTERLTEVGNVSELARRYPATRPTAAGPLAATRP